MSTDYDTKNHKRSHWPEYLRVGLEPRKCLQMTSLSSLFLKLLAISTILVLFILVENTVSAESLLVFLLNITMLWGLTHWAYTCEMGDIDNWTIGE